MEIETEFLIDKIKNDNQELLSRFDPDSCIDFFDRVPDHKPYHYLPETVRTLWAAISADLGESGFDAFQKITMLRLIGRFETRSRGRRYADCIGERFAISFRRIVDSIADPEFALYRSENDILLKDLGLCRQAVFPAGMRVVEPNSGFHRILIFRGGWVQALRFLELLIRTGGHRHWYQVHTHLSELDDFNPDGWIRCCLRLADMMKLHPEIRGLWTGSWFNDPVIETISPRLTYLRKMPQDNGAYVFYSSVAINSGALAKSKTRQKLFEQRKYLPKSYAVIWPRRPLLAWAAVVRAEERP